MKRNNKIIISLVFVLSMMFTGFMTNNVSAVQRNIYIDSLNNIKFDDKYYSPLTDIYKYNEKVVVYYDLAKVTNANYKKDIINAVNQMDNVLKGTAGYLRVTVNKPKTGFYYTVPVTFEHDSNYCKGNLKNIVACASSEKVVFNTRFFTAGKQENIRMVLKLQCHMNLFMSLE